MSKKRQKKKSKKEYIQNQRDQKFILELLVKLNSVNKKTWSVLKKLWLFYWFFLNILFVPLLEVLN